MKKTLVFLAFWVAVAGAQPDWTRVEQTALEEMRAMGVPGAAVGVVRQGRVEWLRGLGVASVETGEAVRPEMLFRLGSTTKMMTAAAVLMAAEEGKLKMDAPLRELVKTLPEGVGAVTLRQLLSHTAGLADRASMMGSHDDEALGRGIAQWKDDALFTAQGRVFSYSNPGYWLAGYAAELAGGAPYATVLETRLFRPLGMTRSTVRPLQAMTYALAQGHDGGPKVTARVVRPAADDASNWPAGSVFSSAAELARWMIALMDAGRIEGRQVLPEWLLERLSRVEARIPGESEGGYGFGLVSDRSRGKLIVQHGGARAGYGSVMVMAPEQKVGVVILANRTGAALNKTAETILASLVELKEEPKEAMGAAVEIAASEFALYAGEYVNGESKAAIVVEEGRLRLNQGKTSLALMKDASGRHWLRPDEAAEPVKVVLVRGAGGRVEYLMQGMRALARR